METTSANARATAKKYLLLNPVVPEMFGFPEDDIYGMKTLVALEGCTLEESQYDDNPANIFYFLQAGDLGDGKDPLRTLQGVVQRNNLDGKVVEIGEVYSNIFYWEYP